MSITLIWCEDKDGGIGLKNKLPWNIPEELQHFKESTLNKVVVMGRKTHDSIGKLLPNRINVILSQNTNLVIEGAHVYSDHVKFLQDFCDQDIWVIGGKKIYELFFNICDNLVISRLKKQYLCDCFLGFNYKKFEIIKQEKHEEFQICRYRKMV